MGSCGSKEAPPSQENKTYSRTERRTVQPPPPLASLDNNSTTNVRNKKNSVPSIQNNQSIVSNKDEQSNSSDTTPTANQNTLYTNNNSNGNLSGNYSSNTITNETQLKNSISSSTNNKEIKILLLGSGESGKSTIIKQMKILHQDGYSREELFEYKPFVYRNILECVKSIINAILELEPSLVDGTPQRDGDINNDEDPEIASDRLQYTQLSELMNYEPPVDPSEPFDLDISKQILRVYRDPKVQKFLQKNRSNFYLMDSAKYFFDSLPRIATEGYVPSVTDVLRTRKKTSGIFETRFSMGGLNIHMYDVGGQRSERRKWIHCFDNVTLIIFCVALSEYNQVLLEENSQNRLEESLILFDSVVNSRWFLRTSVVLFLNKIDVFAEKLPNSPLEDFFPDYTGGNDINKAAKYILWRFTQVNRSGLNIYPHVTQATDTSNIQLVFAAVKETILENSLRDSGIL